MTHQKHDSTPFEFMACIGLRQMLGRSAWDERELLEGIQEAPADSIYFHTTNAFLRSRYISAPYTNDFATWAAIQVGDRVLGERLAVVDPFAFNDVEGLRGELVSIVDDHLRGLQMVPRIVYGEPFHFMRSTIIAVPTGLRAHTLVEFSAALRRVDLSVVYYHIFEPVRDRERVANPANWLEHSLGMPNLAAQVRGLNPYVRSLEGLRARLVELTEQALRTDA
ncbi:MAG TPA: DUF5752 family protein [bacterium]|nr:DUF5752 family protein [bacterium]